MRMPGSYILAPKTIWLLWGSHLKALFEGGWGRRPPPLPKEKEKNKKEEKRKKREKGKQERKKEGN